MAVAFSISAVSLDFRFAGFWMADWCLAGLLAALGIRCRVVFVVMVEREHELLSPLGRTDSLIQQLTHAGGDAGPMAKRPSMIFRTETRSVMEQ